MAGRRSILPPLLLLLSSQIIIVGSFTNNDGVLLNHKSNVIFIQGKILVKCQKPSDQMYPRATRNAHVSLLSSPNPNETDTNRVFPNLSLPYLITWLALIAWTVTLAPGEMTSDSDMEMAISMISNPTSSGVNPLYYTIFNYLGVMPLILASLIMPGAKYSKVSPTPFLLVSAAFGFGAIGENESGTLCDSQNLLFQMHRINLPG